MPAPSGRPPSLGAKRKRLPQATFENAPALFDTEKKSTSLKNRIRSLERLLKKPVSTPLPSDV